MFKPCILVPVYDHAGAIGSVVEQLRPFGLHCWLIDDGSNAHCQATLKEIAAREASWLSLLRLEQNSGKGAAMMLGFGAATKAGYSHGLQVDADGQHDTRSIRELLDNARAHPKALVTGIPIYGDDVPKARLYGRYLTHVWLWINTRSLAIRDSMCGFRVYPLEPSLAVMREEPVGLRMEFDTEIAVRLYWRGVSVVNVPTPVAYPADGVSHFRMGRDNLRISAMHTRLFVTMLTRLMARSLGWGLPLLRPRALPSNRKN